MAPRSQCISDLPPDECADRLGGALRVDTEVREHGATVIYRVHAFLTPITEPSWTTASDELITEYGHFAEAMLEGCLENDQPGPWYLTAVAR